MPQLNTSGNDVTNTVLNISKINRFDAGTERTKTQNKLLDLQLSPEMQASIKAQKDAELANTVAATTSRNLANSKETASQINKRISEVHARMGTEGMKAYTDFYNGVLENPLTKEHAASLPNPEDYIQRDISLPDGKTMTKENTQQLQSILSNYMTATQRAAQGLTTERVQVWDEQGRSSIVYITTQGKKGETLTTEEATGIPGMSFDPPDKGVTPADILAAAKLKETQRHNMAIEKNAAAKAIEPDELTEAQKADDKRSDTKLMISIEKDFSKEDKDGNLPFLATDKAEGQQRADDYNTLAKKHGKSARYVWKEDAYEQEIVPEDRTGVIGNTVDALVHTRDFFKGKDVETESIGGWVKEDVGEVQADSTEAEVQAMSSGDTYTYKGKTYRKN